MKMIAFTLLISLSSASVFSQNQTEDKNAAPAATEISISKAPVASDAEPNKGSLNKASESGTSPDVMTELRSGHAVIKPEKDKEQKKEQQNPTAPASLKVIEPNKNDN